jgi:hypothetical protein
MRRVAAPKKVAKPVQARAKTRTHKKHRVERVIAVLLTVKYRKERELLLAVAWVGTRVGYSCVSLLQWLSTTDRVNKNQQSMQFVRVTVIRFSQSTQLASPAGAFRHPRACQKGLVGIVVTWFIRFAFSF